MKRLCLSLAAGLFSASSAFAASITTSGSGTVLPADVTSIFVDRFDTTLGGLDSVSIDARIASFFFLEVEGALGETVEVELSSSGSILNAFPPEESDFVVGGPFSVTQSFLLDESIPFFPFGDDFGAFLFETTIEGEFELETSDPVVLDFFSTATENEEFPGDGESVVLIFVGDGFGFGIDAFVDVTYDFTPLGVPLPPTWALLLTALAGGAVVARSRRDRA
ncbi:MAG: hypothetical protein AAGF90_04610 [Pseudomonadota bacterium]